MQRELRLLCIECTTGWSASPESLHAKQVYSNVRVSTILLAWADFSSNLNTFPLPLFWQWFKESPRAATAVSSYRAGLFPSLVVTDFQLSPFERTLALWGMGDTTINLHPAGMQRIERFAVFFLKDILVVKIHLLSKAPMPYKHRLCNKIPLVLQTILTWIRTWYAS